MTQRDFLFELGIECRIATLLQHTTNEQTATRHIQDLERLTDNQQMGQIYKVGKPLISLFLMLILLGYGYWSQGPSLPPWILFPHHQRVKIILVINS